MATRRFSYLDDIVLKTGNIGINTSSPTTKVQFVGTCICDNLIVTSGVTTSISFDGFLNTNKNIQSTTIDSGTSSSLSGEIVVGLANTLTISTDAISGQGSIDSMKVSNTFNPPIGGTNDRPSAPKPGSLYYNKDFRTIEYWDGNFWRQVDNTTTSGRAIWNRNSVLHQVNLITGGDATNFGESLTDRTQGGAFGNSIRGIFVGDSSMNTNMDYVALASHGSSVDFGNSSQGRRYGSGHSSSTRGLYAGGRTPGLVDTIDYVEIMTTGNAIDFGNLTFSGRTYNTGCGSPTRGLFANSGNEPSRGKLDKVTIASTGNASDFGKSGFSGGYFAGTSNSVRALFGGRRTPGQGLSIGDVNSVIVASDGNGTYFGDLTIARVFATATSSSTRGVWMGGKTAQSPLTEAYTTRIDYFNFDSAGNATDFGDLTYINNSRSDLACATSDCHGGLGGY